MYKLYGVIVSVYLLKFGLGFIPPEASPKLIINLTPAVAVTLPGVIAIGMVAELELAPKEKEPEFAIV